MSTAQPAAARPGAVRKPNAKAKFHFLHGDDEAQIELYKSAIIEQHLAADERQDNYAEFIAGSGAGSLARVLGDLTAELATVSLLPDAKRVVTLYGGSDFFDGGSRRGRTATKKKAGAAPAGKSASEILAHFIREELPHTVGVLIVIAVEDYERWKRIWTSNPVVQLAQQGNTLVAFREQGAQFAFFDALFARNTGEAIVQWRNWSERAKGAPKLYYSLASQLRLLIQAKTVSSNQAQARGLTREQFASQMMPRESDKSLYALQPEWRREKFMRAAGNFTFQELLSGYEKLSELQRYAIPLNSDRYVPDKDLLAELWIVEFTSRAS